MVTGPRTARQVLRALRGKAQAAGYTVEQPSKGGGRIIGKGSHQAWALYDAEGRELARSLVPGHAGDLSMTVIRSIERAFQPWLGEGWLDQ